MHHIASTGEMDAKTLKKSRSELGCPSDMRFILPAEIASSTTGFWAIAARANAPHCKHRGDGRQNSYEEQEKNLAALPICVSYYLPK